MLNAGKNNFVDRAKVAARKLLFKEFLSFWLEYDGHTHTLDPFQKFGKSTIFQLRSPIS